jgi:hypothetical protein
MFSDTTSSRFLRAVGNKIGVQKCKLFCSKYFIKKNAYTLYFYIMHWYARKRVEDGWNKVIK